MANVRASLVIYAAARVVAGAVWGWRAPPNPDEQRYYLPAAQYFAERLPNVPVDYPMPMPPFVLAVQGILWRITGSVAVLRMLSTVAAIGAAWVVASMMGNTRNEALLLVMIATHPAALMNAFTLKHHSFVLLCCVGSLALWERKRVGPAAVLLAIAALTHQIAVAMIGTLFLLSVIERRWRDAVLVTLPVLPLMALIVFWGGARPPMHEATFTGEPSVSGLQPVQILVLLFMAGVWIAPGLRIRWKVAAIALPFTAIWMHAAGLMRPASVYERLAGPVSSLIAAIARQPVAAAVAAGALAALGIALYFEKHVQLAVWSAMYAGVMLAVPYFFESYYALFVAVAWVLLRRRAAEMPAWFPVAATLAGIGYVVVKA